MDHRQIVKKFIPLESRKKVNRDGANTRREGERSAVLVPENLDFLSAGTVARISDVGIVAPAGFVALGVKGAGGVDVLDEVQVRLAARVVSGLSVETEHAHGLAGPGEINNIAAAHLQVQA